MTWGMVAVGGATVIGAGMQADAASDARRAAGKASAEELAFAKQQYDDWQDVYGPIQDNLSEYYSSLTPEFFEAAGIESYETEFQSAMKTVERNLAQRGIDPQSGIAASLTSQAEIAKAEEKAEIRRDAPRQVAEDKTRFLQIGMGSDPSSSLQSTLARRSSQAQQIANLQTQASGEATAAAVKEVGTALQGYLDKE